MIFNNMCAMYDMCDLLTKLGVIDDVEWSGLDNVVVDG